MPKHSSHHMTGALKGSNPDKGPPMKEGEHHYDKGYESDHDHFSPKGAFPGDHERGNEYMKHQNEIVNKDSTKLRREKFSKIH